MPGRGQRGLLVVSFGVVLAAVLLSAAAPAHSLASQRSIEPAAQPEQVVAEDAIEAILRAAEQVGMSEEDVESLARYLFADSVGDGFNPIVGLQPGLGATDADIIALLFVNATVEDIAKLFPHLERRGDALVCDGLVIVCDQDREAVRLTRVRYVLSYLVMAEVIASEEGRRKELGITLDVERPDGNPPFDQQPGFIDIFNLATDAFGIGSDNGGPWQYRHLIHDEVGPFTRMPTDGFGYINANVYVGVIPWDEFDGGMLRSLRGFAFEQGNQGLRADVAPDPDRDYLVVDDGRPTVVIGAPEPTPSPTPSPSPSPSPSPTASPSPGASPSPTATPIEAPFGEPQQFDPGPLDDPALWLGVTGGGALAVVIALALWFFSPEPGRPPVELEERTLAGRFGGGCILPLVLVATLIAVGVAMVWSG